jgi:putative (di)nucleoside polyphosphate hydrolase
VQKGGAINFFVKQKKYRDNVCAVIRKKTDNSVCIFHRKGYPAETGWQFPQGGIDADRDLIEEMKRELKEEIGTDEVTVIRVSAQRYRYDFPSGVSAKYKAYQGQEQTWILVELIDETFPFVFIGDDVEFDLYQWVTPLEAIKRIVDFKKRIYREALKELRVID